MIQTAAMHLNAKMAVKESGREHVIFFSLAIKRLTLVPVNALHAMMTEES